MTRLDLPYQKEGVKFLRQRDCALLADEPGLGKTAQAIMAADKIGAEAKNADATATRDRASAFKDVASAAMDIAGAKQPGGDMAPGQNTGRPNAFSPAVTGA